MNESRTSLLEVMSLRLQQTQLVPKVKAIWLPSRAGKLHGDTCIEAQNDYKSNT